MELSQRVWIPVRQALVWQALNDPEILKQCLPGCESFEAVADPVGDAVADPVGDAAADKEFEVVLIAKVGPVKAKFKGEVILTDVQAPVSYKISGTGKGGVAGFAKGAAEVSLKSSDDGESTLMSYQVTASVGGKLAQIGSRLVTGAARKMAADFFTGFVRLLSGDENMTVEIETLET